MHREMTQYEFSMEHVLDILGHLMEQWRIYM